jgi:hypothetical protein
MLDAFLVYVTCSSSCDDTQIGLIKKLKQMRERPKTCRNFPCRLIAKQLTSKAVISGPRSDETKKLESLQLTVLVVRSHLHGQKSSSWGAENGKSFSFLEISHHFFLSTVSQSDMRYLFTIFVMFNSNSNGYLPRRKANFISEIPTQRSDFIL